VAVLDVEAHNVPLDVTSTDELVELSTSTDSLDACEDAVIRPSDLRQEHLSAVINERLEKADEDGRELPLERAPENSVLLRRRDPRRLEKES